ncbi:MAG: hypothetical protein ACTHMR_11835 [Thermomicrobiales bacterium]
MSEELTVRRGPKPLLTIETFAPERQPISIDGVIYQMRSLNEFGVLQRLDITRIWAQHYALLQKAATSEPLDPDELLVVDDGTNRILRAALPDVPKDVFDRINSAYREALLRLFFQLNVTPEGQQKVTPLPARRSTRSTGGRKSRASGASTARQTGG